MLKKKGIVRLKLIIVLFGAAMLLGAADVTGKWIGTSEFVNRGGEVRTGPISMTLKQNGDAVIGTAGPSSERQHEIRNGRLAGDKLTFEIADSSGHAMVELLAGDSTLKGEAKFHREYGVVTMKLDLKRE
jgi:hypothetical protein